MKKVTIALLLLLPLTGMAQHAFTIQGKAGHLNAPAKAYLSYLQGDGQMKSDSALLHDGVFTFKGTVDEPSMGRITLAHLGENQYALRNADNISILVTAGVQTITTSDSLVHAVAKGNALVADFDKISRAKAAQENRLAVLIAKSKATPAALRDTKAEGVEYQATFEDVLAKNEAADMNYARTHPASQLSPLLMVWHVAQAPLKEANAIYNAFTPAVKATQVSQAIARKLESRNTILVGGKAPDFQLPDSTGKAITLASFKGKYVLVDFWASWCKPCRAENPNVVKAYDTYKDRNFTVLGVSLDRDGDRDKWLKAVADDQIGRWTQVADLTGWRSPVVDLYGLKSIPQNVLIDPSGKIIAKNLRGDSLQIQLAALLH